MSRVLTCDQCGSTEIDRRGLHLDWTKYYYGSEQRVVSTVRCAVDFCSPSCLAAYAASGLEHGDVSSK